MCRHRRDKDELRKGPDVAYRKLLLYISENGELVLCPHTGAQAGTNDWQASKTLVASGLESVVLAAADMSQSASCAYLVDAGGELTLLSLSDSRPTEIIIRSLEGARHVFAGDGRIIYVIDAAGDLQWYRWNYTPNGYVVEGPRKVGWGWAGVRAVCSGSNGRLYSVTPDGTLNWYHHKGSADGTFDWVGPVAVGSGWSGVRLMTHGDNGIIYAAMEDGELRWFRHLGALTGQAEWLGANVVGSGWYIARLMM